MHLNCFWHLIDSDAGIKRDHYNGLYKKRDKIKQSEKSFALFPISLFRTAMGETKKNAKCAVDYFTEKKQRK